MMLELSPHNCQVGSKAFFAGEPSTTTGSRLPTKNTRASTTMRSASAVTIGSTSITSNNSITDVDIGNVHRPTRTTNCSNNRVIDLDIDSVRRTSTIAVCNSSFLDIGCEHEQLLPSHCGGQQEPLLLHQPPHYGSTVSLSHDCVASSPLYPNCTPQQYEGAFHSHTPEVIPSCHASGASPSSCQSLDRSPALYSPPWDGAIVVTSYDARAGAVTDGNEWMEEWPGKSENLVICERLVMCFINCTFIFRDILFLPTTCK